LSHRETLAAYQLGPFLSSAKEVELASEYPIGLDRGGARAVVACHGVSGQPPDFLNRHARRPQNSAWRLR
jgi:hypothetical protein